MPTYEYACTACSHEWEAEQSIKDDALKDCPKCKEATAKRQISRGTGFILKGGGWYSDLYASGSNKKSEGKSESESSAPAAKSDDATKQFHDRFEKVSGIRVGGGSGEGSSGGDGGSSGGGGSSSGSGGASGSQASSSAA